MVPDDRGRITSTTTPLTGKTSTEYNTADEKTKVTDPDGVVSEFRYDAAGRALAEIIGGALATGYGYDAIGRTTTVTSPTVSGGVLSAALRTARTAYGRVGSRLSREAAVCESVA